jgi:hypothetical protein
MMPDMSGMLLNKFKVENCFYGEFIDMMKPENGWLYEVADPRYMSNYFGLRNRLGILNENYVYADYKSRVLGCYFLIKSLLDYSSTHNAEIKSMLNSADQKVIARGMNPSVTDSFAIEFKVRPISEKVTIKTFEAEIVSDANGRKSYRKSDRQKTVTVPYYIDYYPAKNVKFPFAYVLTVNDKEIIDLLKIHGIELGKLSSPVKTEVEKFEISSLKGAARLNQGHYTNTINGSIINETIEFKTGTIVIKTAQPLASLAAYLLEPLSTDGLATWNYFDRYLVPQWGSGYYPYPVYKVMNKIELKTEPLN